MTNQTFNTIAHPDEKFSKDTLDERSIIDFINFLMKIGISDAGFEGTKHTWTNNRQGEENILERLDRFLVNGNLYMLMKCLKLLIYRELHRITPITCVKSLPIRGQNPDSTRCVSGSPTRASILF